MGQAGRFFLTIFLVASPSWGAIPGIKELFETHYKKHYRPRFCGENILRFARAIGESKDTLPRLAVLRLTNAGLTVFGMVNAENARGSEANWYHHFLAMDDEGNVYDFDFDTTPRVPSLAAYVEEMFLDEKECDKPALGEFCAGRDNKLSDYRAEIFALEDVLRGDESRKKVVRLGDLLKDWRIAFD